MATTSSTRTIGEQMLAEVEGGEYGSALFVIEDAPHHDAYQASLGLGGRWCALQQGTGDVMRAIHAAFAPALAAAGITLTPKTERLPSYIDLGGTGLPMATWRKGERVWDVRLSCRRDGDGWAVTGAFVRRGAGLDLSSVKLPASALPALERALNAYLSTPLLPGADD